MQPLDPSEIVNSVPPQVSWPLIQAVQRAYHGTEQIIADHPILSSGPHVGLARGFNRYVLVEHHVAKAHKDALLPGDVSWIPFDGNESGYYLQYSFGLVTVTFSHVHRLYDIPRRSEYRINRAYSNQLRLELDPPSTTVPNQAAHLVLLHGSQSLDFAQFAILGVDERDRQIALAYSKNLLGEGLEPGAFAGSEPIEPAPVEGVGEAQVRLRREFTEHESEGAS